MTSDEMLDQREDVIKELEVPCDCFSYDNDRCYHPDFTIDRMADEIVRLRAILAALREPSEAVMVGAFSAGAVWDVVTHTRKTIQLAVAAAEQEVANEVR